MPDLFLLRLLGIGKWLRSAAGSLFSAVRAYPLQAALIAAVLACGWLWHGWSHEKAKHLADNARFTAQIFAMDSASKANAAAQLAQKAKWETTSQTLAKESDNEYAKGLADGRGRADAYALAHRVRADKSGFRASSPAGQTDIAKGGDGPGDAADMVAVTRANFDICTVNSQRLDLVHLWGEKLIQAGLAKAAE